MRKGLKIGLGITGGILGFVVIAVLVVMYLVLTPARLTPIVKQVAGNYLTCPYDLDRAELTLVKTFPWIGVDVQGLTLVNKMDGAPCDTLARIDHLKAAVDIKEVLSGHVIDLRGVEGQGIQANLYTNQDGKVNYDVINYESDTTDTTSSWTLKALNLNTIELCDVNARYTDEKLGVDARVSQGKLELEGSIRDAENMTGDVQAKLTAQVQAKYQKDGMQAQLQNCQVAVAGRMTDLDDLVGQATAQVSGRMQAQYLQDDIKAQVKDGDFQVKAEVSDMQKLIGQLDAQLQIPELSARVGQTQYIDGKSASVSLPVHFDLEDMRFVLDSTRVQLDQFPLNLKGWAEVHDTISMDVNFGLDGWQVKPLLGMLPQQYQQMISDLRADGQLGVTGEVVGQYADSTLLPSLRVGLTLKDGSGSYAGIPYELRDVQAQIDLDMDLNNLENADLHIADLEAKTRNSAVSLSGDIRDLMGNTALDLLVGADVQVSDFKEYIPNDIQVQGTAKGGFNVRGLLSDFTDMNLQKTQINGQMQVSQFRLDMDSLHANTPQALLSLQLPAIGKARNGKARWADVKLDSKQLLASMDGAGRVTLSDLNVDAQTCDLLNLGTDFLGNVNFSASKVEAATDSLSASLTSTQGNVDVDYDMTGKKSVPTLKATIKAQTLQALMDTIQVAAQNPDVTAYLRSDPKDPAKINVKFDYQGGQLSGKMGEYASATVQGLAVSGSAREKEVQDDNALLQWNPRLKLKLNQADIHVKDLTTQIQVPMIDMKYSNRHFVINDSRLIVGNSDFKLTGEIDNIGRWIQKKDTLKGELNFTSDQTDVNELMDLFSGSCETDEALQADLEKEVQNPDTTANPFIVPGLTDLLLHVRIKKAFIGNETAQNLNGDLTVKDGVVDLQSIGFICEAARFQLRGKYKTPRVNHIFAGFDLDMMDIDVEKLLGMFDQIYLMVPMLKSFKGDVDFHLTLETYFDRHYNIKTSTAIGAAYMDGKNLVLLDGETFTKVAHLLLFKKKQENKIDSISVAATLQNGVLKIYPFSVSMDKYQLAAGGLNKNISSVIKQGSIDPLQYDYDVAILSPLWLGVKAKTNKRGKLCILPELPKFKKGFIPDRTDGIYEQDRAIIKKALTSDVK